MAMALVMGSKMRNQDGRYEARKPIPFDLIPMETVWVMVGRRQPERRG